MIICSTSTWAIARMFLDRKPLLRSGRHNGYDDSCFCKAREDGIKNAYDFSSGVNLDG
jgi:hypothetical protein